MKNILSQQLWRQRGVYILNLLILLPVIILLAAVALNIGWVYYVRKQVQSTVEAAALAAVAGVPEYNIWDVALGNSPKVVELLEMFNGNAAVTGTNAIMGQNPGITEENTRYIVYRRQWNLTTKTYDPPTINYFPYNLNDQNQRKRINGIEVCLPWAVPIFFGGLVGMDVLNINVCAAAALTGPWCYPIRAPLVLIQCTGGPGEDMCTQDRCGGTFEFTTNPPVNTASKWDVASIFAIPGQNPPNASYCREKIRNQVAGELLCIGQGIQLNNGLVPSCFDEMKRQCDGEFDCQNNAHRFTVPWVSCEDISDPPVLNESVPIRGFVRIGMTDINVFGNPKTVKFNKLCGEEQIGIVNGAPPCNFYGTPTLIY